MHHYWVIVNQVPVLLLPFSPLLTSQSLSDSVCKMGIKVALCSIFASVAVKYGKSLPQGLKHSACLINAMIWQFILLLLFEHFNQDFHVIYLFIISETVASWPPMVTVLVACSQLTLGGWRNGIHWDVTSNRISRRYRETDAETSPRDELAKDSGRKEWEIHVRERES